METKIERKEYKRGVFLWIMLALYIYFSLQRLITLLLPVTFSQIYAGGPNWGYSFNIVAFIVEAAGVIGVIFWKKWGVYLLVLINLAEIFVDQVYFTPRPSSIVGWGLTLVLIGLLIWATRRKWQFFK